MTMNMIMLGACKRRPNLWYLNGPKVLFSFNMAEKSVKVSN